MDEVARLMNEMVEAGVISNFAVFGVVAQMRYTEAVATFDADILVDVRDHGACRTPRLLGIECYHGASMPSGR